MKEAARNTPPLDAGAVAISEDMRLKKLRTLVESARSLLAEVEATYTIERAKVDALQATLFTRLRRYCQERDRLRLVVDYRKEFLEARLRRDKKDVEKIAQDYREAQSKSDREYEETASKLSAKKELTTEEEAELGKLWKKLVKLYHPDRFAHEPDKLETLQQTHRRDQSRERYRRSGNAEADRERSACVYFAARLGKS